MNISSTIATFIITAHGFNSAILLLLAPSYRFRRGKVVLEQACTSSIGRLSSLRSSSSLSSSPVLYSRATTDQHILSVAPKMDRTSLLLSPATLSLGHLLDCLENHSGRARISESQLKSAPKNCSAAMPTLLPSKTRNGTSCRATLPWGCRRRFR